MAILDTAANEIVIRVVYDGPPEAGKTTSMRALGASLSQSTVSPEEDAGGRTLWFDWMEYVGGRFEGSRIRCQIVSVPGQRELGARRKLLLGSADVVVFVGDSTPARWDVSLDYLFELRGLVAKDVGVVFQANKRDAVGAIDLDQLRLRLGDARWSIGVVESVAADGTGIREAFVYGVRLALDRVREMIVAGTLKEGPPELTSPEQLLAQLRGISASGSGAMPRVRVAPVDSVAGTLLRDILDAETAVAVSAAPIEVAGTWAGGPVGPAPRPPDATVPSGAIWPPVEGRALLYEVSQLPLAVRRLANGDWVAGLGTGWRVVSSRDAAFESLDAGRAALVVWARLHAACVPVVSPRRCIVLAATGDGSWRLWQIVRAESSLRDHAAGAASEPTPDLAVFRLCETARLLVDFHARVEAMPCALPCGLDTVGQTDARAVYIGLMPEIGAVDRDDRSAAELVESELGPVVELDLASQRDALGTALQRIPQRFGHADVVVPTLTGLLRA